MGASGLEESIYHNLPGEGPPYAKIEKCTRMLQDVGLCGRRHKQPTDSSVRDKVYGMRLIERDCHRCYHKGISPNFQAINLYIFHFHFYFTLDFHVPHHNPSFPPVLLSLPPTFALS